MDEDSDTPAGRRSVEPQSFAWSKTPVLKRSSMSNHFQLGRALSWHQVNLKVSSKTTKEKVHVLKNASGSAQPFQLSAIMGLSGSGKTSLLNVLSGRRSASSNTELSHEIFLDKEKINPSKRKQLFAYVEQHDTLLSTATAREAIVFSARLRLSNNNSDEIDEIVDAILTGLTLQDSANTLIGSRVLPGLSGGEKRRVSLGVELVASPKIIFADEVTSGLDSSGAVQVMEALKYLATQGSSVLVTVHQPDSHIFSLFDNLILMHKGYALFSGPTRDISDYFGERGYQMTSGYNTADWVISVARSLKTETDIQEKHFGEHFPSDEDDINQTGVTRGDSLSEENSPKESDASQPDPTGGRSAGVRWHIVFSELMKRQVRNFVRNSHLMKLRFGMSLLGGLLVAVFMTQVAANSFDEGSSLSFQSHVGACFLVIMCVIITNQVIMLDFVEQRPLFEYEYSRNYYGILAFSLSQLTFETISVFLQLLVYFLVVYWAVGFQGSFFVLFSCLFVFAMVCGSIGIAVASAVRDPASAKELIPMTVLPQFLLCGFFIAPDDVPSWLQWASWIAPLTYTFRLFINEEFHFCGKVNILQPEARACFGALVGAGFDITSEDGPWYTDNTTMVFPQYGTYKGRDQIVEYFALTRALGSTEGSAAQSCLVKDTLRVVDFNMDEPGYCDVTFGVIPNTRLNPEVSALDERQLLEYVNGIRLLFPLSTGDETLALDQINIYYHSNALKTLTDGLDNDKVVNEVCTTMENTCESVFDANAFHSQEECVDRMRTIPSREEFQDHVYNDGNTTGCRLVHMFLARSNPDHCPHISYLPIKDKNGALKCSKTSLLDQADYFSEESFRGFDQIALSYGIDPVKSLNIVDPAQAGTCSSNFQEDLLSFFDADNLEVVCQLYLTEQKATDSFRGQYWGTSLCILVGVRVLGAVILRLRMNG